MKKILLIITILNILLWSEDLCGLDTRNIVKKLETKYAKEIKSLDFNFEEGYRDLDATCEKIPKTDKIVFAFPYAVGEDGLYTLSLILAIVERKTQKIEQSYFHKEIADSDAIYISGIELDTSLYEKDILKLLLSFVGSSRANPYSLERMYLYRIRENMVDVILNGVDLSELHGENDMCNYYDASHDYIWLKKKAFTFPNNIVFKHVYEYEESDCEDESKEEHWSVKLEPLKLMYKNGKYKVVSKKKPIFNLKEVEKNAKKGLNYKEVVLRAMLFEEYLFKGNVNRYNDIAYYLQKAGHNREAIVLLEEIIERFPKRVVAYLNLGDSYWGESDTSNAVVRYKQYIKLMKEKHKVKKIPPYVLERVADVKDFSKGFVKKYTKIDTLPPIFLEKMNGTKPLEIVPWMQKKIMRIDKEDGLLIHVLAYEKEDDVEFVYFVQSRRDERIDSQFVKGDITMYKFSYKNQTNIFIVRFPTRILTSDKGIEGTTLDGWNTFNRQEFILDNGYLYFKESRCEDKHNSFCYEYKYKFGDNKVSKATEYSTKNWYKRWNHKHDTFIYDGDSFDIGHMEDGKKVMKSLFTIKSLKDKNIRGETIPFTIGGTSWSEDDKKLYFDNHDIALACIWRYNLETKELSKIVPEHEAEHPFAFSYKGKEYVVYVEGQEIKVAREFKK